MIKTYFEYFFKYWNQIPTSNELKKLFKTTSNNLMPLLLSPIEMIVLVRVRTGLSLTFVPVDLSTTLYSTTAIFSVIFKSRTLYVY